MLPTHPCCLAICTQCGMARLPGTPTLLVMYANFLIEVPKDGQAARTQMQLAAKATPGVMDAYNIFVTQQLAKLLKRGAHTVFYALSPLSCFA